MAVTEKGLTKLKKQLKDKKLDKLYLFFGDEKYLKDVYVERVEKLASDGDSFAEFNHTIVSGKDHLLTDLEGMIEGYPMMAERKTIIFRDSGIFKSPNENEKQFWTNRLADIPDYLVLVFDETEVDKRSATYKALAKHGTAVEFEYLKTVEVVTWVQGVVLRAGKKIDKSDAEYFVGMCDDGLANVRNELDKLINYCGMTIFRSDIDNVVSKSLQVRIFELTDGMMEKDTSKVMNTLADLKVIKEPVFRILAILLGTFDKMLHAKLMIAQGSTMGEIAAKIGVSPFLASKYEKSAKAFSESYLIDRICAIANINYSIINGETEDWPSLEQYIMESVYKR